MSVAAVVLAAGFSRRLGRPKQTLEINGETLLQRAVRVAHEAELEPVFVVTTAHLAEDLAADTVACDLVLNGEAEEGIASSIRAGVRAAEAVQDVAGIVVMTCDQVSTSADHLRALCAHSEQMTGSAYAGRVGVPAYFPRASFSQLLQLEGDAGARDLLRSAEAISAEELALDIDTEEDLERARVLFAPQ